MEDEVKYGAMVAPPAITTAPHAKDLEHRLELRQNGNNVCGYIGASFSMSNQS